MAIWLRGVNNVEIILIRHYHVLLYTCTFLRRFDNVGNIQIIRIFNACEVRIEKSITRVNVRFDITRPAKVFRVQRTTIMDYFSCIPFLQHFYLSLNNLKKRNLIDLNLIIISRLAEKICSA